MIEVQYMEPFYTNVAGDKLRLVFTHKCFAITKEGELYQFIPIEGKEIIVNMDTGQIENLSEIFVFHQRHNRFIRIPLFQLMLVSNMHEHLVSILEKCSPRKSETSKVQLEDVSALIRELEQQNYSYLIDQALLDNDKELFYELVRRKGEC